MKTHLRTSRASGFTMVELLVVIAIIVLLALVAVVATRAVMQKATAANALSRLRQSGTILASHAFENNGRYQFSETITAADSPYLPYNIVRQSMNLRLAGDGSAMGELCEIMHWDFKKVPPSVYHRDCFGVNFTDVASSPDGLNAKWSQETTQDENGDPVDLLTLVTNKVDRPDLYPILLDSSTAQGDEIYRIMESANHLVGLRNSEKANAFFLDGSARALTKAELKRSGFTRAFDNSSKPPKGTSL